MLPPEERPRLERLRQVVAAHVESTGLRPVAREIGIDPKAVTKFLNGSTPRPQTRVKLERWYVLQVANSAASVERDEAEAALKILMGGLSPAQRTGVLPDAVIFFRQLYVRHGTPVPTWLAELSRELAG
jgi:hypothetical protein